jgi:hypothetical protein
MLPQEDIWVTVYMVHLRASNPSFEPFIMLELAIVIPIAIFVFGS